MIFSFHSDQYSAKMEVEISGTWTLGRLFSSAFQAASTSNPVSTRLEGVWGRIHPWTGSTMSQPPWSAVVPGVDDSSSMCPAVHLGRMPGLDGCRSGGTNSPGRRREDRFAVMDQLLKSCCVPS